MMMIRRTPYMIRRQAPSDRKYSRKPTTRRPAKIEPQRVPRPPT
jgi:hypothetical protein